MPGVQAQNWIIPGVAGLAVAVLTVLVRARKRPEPSTGAGP